MESTEMPKKPVPPQTPTPPAGARPLAPQPGLRRSGAAPAPVRKLQTGSAGKDVANAAKNVAVGTAKAVVDIASEAVSDFAETYLPFLGTVWFSNGKSLMGLLHLLICCVIVPVGVFMSPLGGDAPLAGILKFAAAVVGAWVVGFVLSFIGAMIADAKNAKEMLSKVIIGVVIVCAVLLYEAFLA